MIVKVPEKKFQEIQKQNWILIHTKATLQQNNFLWDPNDRPCGTVLDVQ